MPNLELGAGRVVPGSGDAQLRLAPKLDRSTVRLETTGAPVRECVAANLREVENGRDGR